MEPAVNSCTKIVAIEDHDIVLEGIRSVIRSRSDFLIVAEATYGEQILPLIEKHDPHIVLIDLNIPTSHLSNEPFDTLNLISKISQCSNTSVIVISQWALPSYVQSALEAGARAFLDKAEGIRGQLPLAIDAVLKGNSYFSGTVSRILVENQIGSSNPLTTRQTSVLELLARYPNYATAAYAQELGIQESTFKKHLALVFRKLNVNTRTAAVLKAIELGIVSTSLPQKPKLINLKPVSS